MAHSKTNAKKSKITTPPKRKRNERLCVTVTDTFKQEVEVLAFLLAYRNVTAFIKARIFNSKNLLVSHASTEKEVATFKQVFFAAQKGDADQTTSQIRFYVTDLERKYIDKMTKESDYTHYSDFILSQIVPLVEKNQKPIDAYLDYQENAQAQVKYYLQNQIQT